MKTKICCSLAAVLIAVLVPAAANASSGSVTQTSTPTNYPVKAPYKSLKPKSGFSAMASTPTNCYQRTHDPHKSGHKPETMNAEVQTRCDFEVPFISQTGQLWEKRWYGWDRVGAKGSNSKSWTRELSTFANDKCRNNQVYATGSGYVRENDNTIWGASSQSPVVRIYC